MLPAALLSVVSTLWLTPAAEARGLGSLEAPTREEAAQVAPVRERPRARTLAPPSSATTPARPSIRRDEGRGIVGDVIHLAGTQLVDVRAEVVKRLDGIGLGFAVPKVGALIGLGVSRATTRREGWYGGLDGARGLSNGAVFDMGVVSLVDAAIASERSGTSEAARAPAAQVQPDVSIGLDGAASMGVAGVF